MIYKGSNKTYDFRTFETIHVFGNEIRNNIINMSMTNDEQNHFSKHIRDAKCKREPQNSKSKKVKEDVLDSAIALLKGREVIRIPFLMVF